MKLFRKIASHYISMAVSFHYLLGHPAAGKEDMAITKTGVILLIVHLMNVATVLLLVLSPSQMDTLASLFAGTSRFATVGCLFLLFAAVGGGGIPAMRRRVREVAENDKLLVRVRGGWRLSVIVYLVLSVGGIAAAFAIAVSRRA